MSGENVQHCLCCPCTAAVLGAVGRERGLAVLGSSKVSSRRVLCPQMCTHWIRCVPDVCLPPPPVSNSVCIHELWADSARWVWEELRSCAYRDEQPQGLTPGVPVVTTFFGTPRLVCSSRTGPRHCCAGIKEAQGHIQLLVQEDTSSWAAAVWGDDSQP